MMGILFLWSPPARADRPIALAYEAPAGCPLRAELIARTRARAPSVSVVERATPGSREYSVTVRRTARGYSAALTVDAAVDAQTVEAPTCDEAVSAMAITLSLSLEAGDERPPQTPPIAPLPVSRAARPKPTNVDRVELGVGLATEVGALRVAVGPTVLVGLRSGRVPAAARVSLGAIRTLEGPEEARLTSFRGRLDATYDGNVLGIRLGPRLGLEGGIVLAEGRALAAPRTTALPWAAVRAGLAAVVRPVAALPRLELAVSLVLPLTRPRLLRETPDREVFLAGPLAVSFDLATIVDLP